MANNATKIYSAYENEPTVYKNTNLAKFQEQTAKPTVYNAPQAGSTLAEQAQFSQNMSDAFGANSTLANQSISRQNQVLNQESGVSANNVAPTNTVVNPTIAQQNLQRSTTASSSAQTELNTQATNKYQANLDAYKKSQNIGESLTPSQMAYKKSIGETVNYANDPDIAKLQQQLYNTSDSNARKAIKTQIDQLASEKAGISQGTVSQEQLDQRTRDYSFGGTGMTEEQKIASKMNLPKDVTIERDEDGLFKQVDQKKEFEADPIKRAEARLEEDRETAITKLNDSYDPVIKKLKAQTDIYGNIPPQTKKKLNDIYSERADSLAEIEKRVERNREDLLIKEREQQTDYEEYLEEDEEDRIKKIQAQEHLDAINEKISSGEAQTYTQAEILVNRDNKIFGTDDKSLKEASKLLTAQLASGQVDSDNMLGYIMTLPNVESIEDAEKLMKSNRVPDSIINDKIMEYQTDVLGFDEEFVKEKTDVEKLVKRKTDYFSGGMQKDSMGLDLVGLASSMKDDDLEQALYQQVLMTPDAPEHIKTLASLKLGEMVESNELSKSEIEAKIYSGQATDDEIRAYQRGQSVIEGSTGGVSANILSAVQSNPELYDSLSTKTREDLLKSGYTPQTQGSESFDDLLSMSPTIYGIPTQLVNSDAESERFQATVKAGLKEGMSRYEIQKAYLGYNIEDSSNDKFAEGILSYIQSLDNPSTSDYQNTARLINSGQKVKAIDRIENKLLAEKDPDFINKKRLTHEITTKALDIQDLLEEIDPSMLGAFDSQQLKFTKKYIGRTTEDEIKGQELQSKIVALIQPWRKENLGSAVTPSEEKALEDLISSISDQPELLSTKINEFAESALIGYNSARDTAGLPQIGFDEIINEDSLVDVYTNEFNPKQQEPVQQTQPEINGATAGIGSLSPQEFQRNMQKTKLKELGLSDDEINDYLGEKKKPQVSIENKITRTEGSNGGQCTTYARTIVPDLPSGLWSKQDKIDKVVNGSKGVPKETIVSDPKAGDVIITDEGEYGHVAVIKTVLPNGEVELTESNYDLDEKIDHNRKITLKDSKILGGWRSS